jgi:hypothetical protein
MVFLSSPLCEGSMHNIFANCKNLFEEFDLCNALVRLSGRHKLYIFEVLSFRMKEHCQGKSAGVQPHQ